MNESIAGGDVGRDLGRDFPAEQERESRPLWITGEVNTKSVHIKLADYTVDAANSVVMLVCLRCERTVSARSSSVRADTILRDMAAHEAGSSTH